MWGIGGQNHRGQADGSYTTRQVFYADGEKVSTGMVEAALHQLELTVTHFASAEQCLDCLGTHECHLLISNSRRPAREGMRLLADAKRIKASLPVILLVDHGDIDVAVHAMKGGAADCLERPPEKAHLISAIDSALRASIQRSLPGDCPLSKAEGEVLRLVLQGNTTAEVARILDRSRRTVEVHRSRIMAKFKAQSAVDLVKTCVRMGLLEHWP